MIRLSGLIPFNYLGYVAPLMDYDFLEPYNNPQYINFYRTRDTPLKFLDNGLIEMQSPMLMHQLKGYFDKVNATHVASPDKLGDWEFNKWHAKEMAKLLPRESIYVALAGPRPIDFYIQNWWVKRVGFGGVCLPYRLNRVPVRNPNVHMFGLRIPEQHREFGDATLDTTEPINAALHGTEYQMAGMSSYKRLPNYMTRFFEPGMPSRIERNINYMKGVLNR